MTEEDGIDVPDDDRLRALYPEVDAFARQMRAELWANRHKGDHAGWRSMTLRQAWGEISWHVAKMAGALKAENVQQIRELAADVANGAMMLDDILVVSGVTDVCRCGIGVRDASPGCAWHEQRAAHERRAPVQAGPNGPAGTISWAEHLRIWDAYSRRYGAGQSAERIAERGGFGHGEIETLTGGLARTFTRAAPEKRERAR